MVIDFLIKKMMELLNTLLAPIWQRIVSSSWGKRAAVLTLLTVITGLAALSGSLVESYHQVSRVVRVLHSYGPNIPIEADIVERIRSSASRISKTLEQELSDLDKFDVDPITTAQMVMGVGANGTFDAIEAQQHIRQTRQSPCNCWQELPKSQGEPSIYVSGWILAALASLKTPATGGEVAFLLSEQNPRGWWSVFPVADQAEFASTYGTAWALFGLQSQLDQHLVSGSDVSAVMSSVRRASAWLLQNREDHGRWKDYPLSRDGVVAMGISAVALHVLHRVDPEITSDLDAQWLDNLPSGVLSANALEAEYHWVYTKGGFQVDAFEHITLPWVLVATVDAYGHGDLRQRVRALAWLENNLQQANISGIEPHYPPWWRAELLYAFRYILARTGD